MKDIVNELLKVDKPVYIAGHIIPDQDSICSSLALAEILLQQNKDVKVLLEDKDIEILSWCDVPSYIVSEVKDNDYVFIALDVNEIKRLGRYADSYLNASHTFNIDHHQGNGCNATYTYSNSLYSSTCEIIYLMSKYIEGINITVTISAYLYSGIVNDTNSFSRRISPYTLSVSQELINNGIDYTNIIKKTLTNRSMYEMKALASFIHDIKYDNFYYLVVDMKDERYNKLTFNQLTKRIAEDLRTIEDIDIFVMLIKYDGYIKAKTMSNRSECAHLIANLFNGGGHKKEAGFTVDDISEREIIERIKEYIKENQPF